MYCSKCGKEISDQAKFCNYCGTQMNDSQPERPQQTAAPKQPTAPKAKKKGKTRKVILGILIAVVVFFAGVYIYENVLYGDVEPSSIYTGEQALVDAFMTNYCDKGALYQDGYLTYSLARVHLPGYELVQGEGDEDDFLKSADGNSVFSADRALEGGTSFKASDADGILESINLLTGDASMVDFRKYEICGHPAIRYIVKYTQEDKDLYGGELIIFESKAESLNAYTVRLMMTSQAEIGQGEIDRVFDSLQFSPDFALGEEYPNIGKNKITVK